MKRVKSSDYGGGDVLGGRCSERDEAKKEGSESPSDKSCDDEPEKKRTGLKKKMMPFIAIHLGAGEHSVKSKEKYRPICNEACEKAMKLLRQDGSAGDAVALATKIIEDSGLVNAGSGSNLTLNGTVECDAGFMDGDGYFGGVGAVSGVRNPILIAKGLADEHRREKLFSCGRIPPSFLVGNGAKTWASNKGLPICDDNALISRRSLKKYEKYKLQLESVANNKVNDTVGAIAVDNRGNVASSVSSGGHWMKLPGRIGHAPLFGCGCYSSNISEHSANAIAVSTSGSGEMLSRIRLPQECACEANNENSFSLVASLMTCVEKHFLKNPTLNIHQEPRYTGIISLTWDGSHGEFAWGHSTSNFVIAYSTYKMRSAKMYFSELGPESVPGQSFRCEGIFF